jgi:PAS domain S-box-containing protein
MDAAVHSFLRQHKDEILRSWEARVASEDRDVERVGLALRNDIPPLLDALADWLAGDEPPELSPVATHALTHVMQRLDESLSLAQVFREYRLLRETVIEAVLGAEADEQDRTGASGEPGRIARIKGVARLNAGLDVVLAQAVVQFTAERDRRAADERTRAEEDLRDSEERYRTLFQTIDEGFCIIEVLFDDAGNPTDYRFVEVNQAFEQHTGLVNPTGKRMREFAPSLEEQWFEIYGRVVVSGEPVRFRNQAQALGRWFEVFAFRVGEPERRMVGILFNDITARTRAEEGLRDSEHRYRTLFTNMTEGFALGEVVYDQAGVPWDVRLIEMNDAFEEQSGLEREKARGRPLREVLPQLEQSWIDTYCDVALGGRARRFESYNRDLDRHFSVYCFSPTHGRFAVVFSDVTERKRVEDALREADRQKTEFLGVLSHELRNPLAPIRNSIFLLERAPPGSEQATHAREVVRRQAEHLTRLVDDLLDITRISHGKIGLQRTRVDLREIVRKTTDDLHSVFAQAGVELRVDYVTFGPVWIDADPTRISQVLGNLLQNAVKFTPSGGAVVVSVGSGDDGAQLRVRDNGAGMDPGAIDQMFAPFAQATQSLARTKGGLGIGLALVKGIIELHGGTVHAHSEGLGRGSEFRVSLPMSQPAAEPEQDRVATTNAIGKLILIIEDNLDAGESLAEIVRMYGHRVQVARDGRTGLALARELRPDVILCDIGLPDLDGYEVASTLRRDEAHRRTRLVALSGYAQPEDRQRARDVGFDAHMAKPPDVDKLMMMIAKET